jgi:hypothetical protein
VPVQRGRRAGQTRPQGRSNAPRPLTALPHVWQAVVEVPPEALVLYVLQKRAVGGQREGRPLRRRRRRRQGVAASRIPRRAQPAGEGAGHPARLPRPPLVSPAPSAVWGGGAPPHLDRGRQAACGPEDDGGVVAEAVGQAKLHWRHQIRSAGPAPRLGLGCWGPLRSPRRRARRCPKRSSAGAGRRPRRSAGDRATGRVVPRNLKGALHCNGCCELRVGPVVPGAICDTPLKYMSLEP